MWIGLLLYLATLGGRAARIQHDLGIIARKYNNADHPLRVPQDAST